ncbi:hypothetical protein [Priestia koreensis]|uniref:Uncharacterized protein n=1 Tax=Priestia koreensis TaxID=284581 RepID=A0A0M0LBU7_9BACI|nr:hypothetical protein [Priestia koreensis]KOO48158.1 hypothetical protein AMD01_04955 [Priestia koreensis]
MSYVERYTVELEDGTFALFGQFVDGESSSILAMGGFYNGTLFRKEQAVLKFEQINKGVWKFLGETKKAKGIRKIEMRMI